MRIVYTLALASIAALALVTSTLALVDAVKSPPKPSALWRQYPLGTRGPARTTVTRPASTPHTATRPVRPAAAVLSAKRGGSDATRPFVIAGLGLAVLLLGLAAVPQAAVPDPRLTYALARHRLEITLAGMAAALGAALLTGPLRAVALGVSAVVLVSAVGGFAFVYIRRRRDRRADERIDVPLKTIALAAARLDNRRRARGVEDQWAAWNKWANESRRRRAVSDQLHDRVEPEASATDAGEGPQSHTDLGDRVSGVIKAAEDLAEQIRVDALEEAADIKRQAEESAAARMREVAQEGDELHAKAEAYAADIRGTGENYATERRREAEAEATKLVEEGEGQARAMREAAEQMALRIETAALQRRDELEERSGVVEARLRRFQAGLAEISREVEELLERRGETLVEALEVDERLPSA